ncbi:IS6 family transposase (plasmid) [Alicyclobacillus fastidiosus]|uniref:IS6 family transposase n=1 Tax=Alicyclobacillus fastidiosus TaxID=392011 RepID=A0ABY6ZQ90_9BACL|nr:IS6 family transposase [Alicyclobacillus fastidiosus]WAH44979.1 IS6 family transposase [Alicyclobacillus fastidiosus]GMA66013.1 IS6 family transposase [Alicyclobacillus fastidiosus]GMA66283.1 IS6 family transposase [Alicyclobacillus fastidiosus]GMA66332.1 IS6 family transposase [Alicyclobacillus fastidiosus]
MNAFKWKHFESHIILTAVRWYLQYSLSYRDIVELLKERGVQVSHTTIMRWVHQYGPEIDKRIRRFLKPTSDSYRVDETYIRVKGQWKYLYRAVDSNGQTIEFMLSANRDVLAAKRFFKKAISSPHNQAPRVITVDKNPAYPPALQQLKCETVIPQATVMRQTKYLNNIVEQDHRFIKKMTNPMLGFKSFQSAEDTLKGIEAMHMLRKGQVKLQHSPVSNVAEFINHLFGLSA